MERQAEYTAGWIDTTIHEFLSKIEEPSSSMAYALLTCLDSCQDIPLLLQKSDHLKALKDKCTLIGKGALLSTRQLLAAERRRRLFFGFDEVWFFPQPEVNAKPPTLRITGPDRIQPELMEAFGEWMRDNGCSLGLGDGTGMNFCFKVRGVARHIVRAFTEAGSAILEGR